MPTVAAGGMNYRILDNAALRQPPSCYISMIYFTIFFAILQGEKRQKTLFFDYFTYFTYIAAFFEILPFTGFNVSAYYANIKQETED